MPIDGSGPAGPSAAATPRGRLVSIVCRTRDRPRLLQAALRSLAAQTYRPIEVVLVNDGGAELDVEALRTLLGTVALDYTALSPGRGRAGAANEGIRRATGAYVGFLDDDDTFRPDHLATLVPALEGLDYRVVYADSLMVQRVWDPERRELVDAARDLVFSRDFDYDALLFGNYIPLLCLLFEREVLVESGGFDPRFELYGDWDLLIRVGERHPFRHVPRVTAHYNRWAPERQIAQDDRDPLRLRQGYLDVLDKHRSRFTPQRIYRHLLTVGEDRQRLAAARAEAATLRADLERATRRTEELAALLAARDGELHRQSEAAASRAATVADLAHQAAHAATVHQTALAASDRRIRALEDTLVDRDAALHRIRSSHGWAFLVQVYRARARLLPDGSRRLAAVRRLASALGGRRRPTDGPHR